MRIIIILGFFSFFFVGCSKQGPNDLQQTPEVVKEQIAITPELTDSNLTSTAKSDTAPQHSQSGLPLDLAKRVLDLTGKGFDSGKTTFDEKHCPVETRFPDHSLIEYKTSLPTKYILPSGQMTEYVYDAQSNLLRILLPDGTFETFVYDEKGAVKMHRRSDGTIIPVKPTD